MVSIWGSCGEETRLCRQVERFLRSLSRTCVLPVHEGVAHYKATVKRHTPPFDFSSFFSYPLEVRQIHTRPCFRWFGVGHGPHQSPPEADQPRAEPIQDQGCGSVP